MSKGKIGDRIVITNTEQIPSSWTLKEGTYAQVVHIDFEGASVAPDGETKTYYFYSTEYEVVSEKLEQTNSSEAVSWETGQEVWCLLRGKGVVTAFDSYGKVYPVRVDFETGSTDWYTSEGKEESNYNRSLFFSDPQIIADKLPPKKPFIPVLKKGDAIVVQTKVENFVSESYVYTVEHETEDEICCLGGDSYTKAYWTVHKLGEKVEFNAK